MCCATRHLRAALTALALLTGVTGVVADPAKAFVNAKGFQAVSADQLEGGRYYSLARFPTLGTSAFHPDADLPAPVRAMLLMDSHEGAVPHARYLISYQPTNEALAPDETRGYVDITRFNLGAAVRADLQESVPSEQLADAKVFGVGPHVRWRFVMSPQRGMSAGLHAVARMRVADKEAATMDCLGQACVRLEAAEGPSGSWAPLPLGERPPSFTRSLPQGPAPASVLEHLLALLGEDAQRAAPFSADAQRLLFVVSANVGGQEQLTTGLARNALVFDDAVGTQWVRFFQVGGSEPEAQQLNQRRK